MTEIERQANFGAPSRLEIFSIDLVRTSIILIFLSIGLSGCVQPNSSGVPMDIGTGVSEISSIRKGEKTAAIVETKTSYRELNDDIEAIFVSRLIEVGLSVITRSDLDRIFNELKFQRGSGITDEDAARIGRMANVRLILVVSHYGVYCGDNRLWARLLQVESGEVVWANRGSLYSCNRTPSFYLPKIAAAVAATMPRVR